MARLGSAGVEQALRSPKPDAFVLAKAAAGLAARPRETAHVREFTLSPAAEVRVEVVRGKPPAALDGDWRDLLARAETLRSLAMQRLRLTASSWLSGARGRNSIDHVAKAI